MGGRFVCEGCGDSWSADPRLAVPCPVCGAKPGRLCKRPSEHTAPRPHAARRRRAFELAPCSCLARWESAQAAKSDPQLSLLAGAS